jgi:GTP-binding protein
VIVDQVEIILCAGKGGEGAKIYRHLPSGKILGIGGGGGKGGDVILKVSSHLYDLSKFKNKKRLSAEDGKKGERDNKKGKDGKDLIVWLPQGTLVKNKEGKVIVDLDEEKKEFLLCRGGKGGKGNFKRDYTTQAKKGEEKEVILDYRIPNDVAILGFPNVGKTSLFNKLTAKNFPVRDYPFTTTNYFWAPVEYEFERFILLDTPPLKKTLPNKKSVNFFLKHIYRSKILLFLSDNFVDFKKEFSLIYKEIIQFDASLLKNGSVNNFSQNYPPPFFVNYLLPRLSSLLPLSNQI